MDQSLWYKEAVFYEINVRAFYDGNGDGHGDLKGLTQKLDYLQSLGITCLWLMPFFPSPLRDDGYDISDYYTVDPRLGTLGDVVGFLDLFDQHYRAFSRGTIKLASVAYYAGLAWASLLVCTAVLSARRWRA